MAWTKIDDGFADHWKLRSINPISRWTHIQALCYAARYLTDGFIPDVVALDFQSDARDWYAQNDDHDDTHDVLGDLLKVNLWVRTDGGYQIKDYLEYNPPRQEIEAKRAERKERAQRAAAARWSPKPVEKKVHAKRYAGSNAKSIAQAAVKNAPVPSPGVSVDTPQGEEPFATAPGPPQATTPEPVVPMSQIAAALGIPLEPPNRRNPPSHDQVDDRRRRQKAALAAGEGITVEELEQRSRSATAEPKEAAE